MASKEYRCHRWPSLSVGTFNDIKFVDGVFRTEDESQQKLIEGLSYYGPVVWHEPDPPKDVVEHVEPKASLEPPIRQKWTIK